MANQVRFLDQVAVSAFGNTGGTETTNTSSLLLTASAATNVITFTKGDGSTFPVTIDTGSAITISTGSLMTTASVSLNTITFTKGDGTTFPILVNTGSTSISSSYATTSSFAQSGNGIFSGSFSGSFEGDGSGLTGVGGDTGSLMTTASAASNVITFTKGDGSTFPITVDTGSGGGGGGSSVGTSNEFQLTDNSGGFTSSLIQQSSSNIIPTTTAGSGAVGTRLGSATNYFFKLHLGGQAASGNPIYSAGIEVQENTDFFIQEEGSPFTSTTMLHITRDTVSSPYLTTNRSIQTRNNGTQHFRIGNSGEMKFGASGTNKNYIQNLYTKFGFWNTGTGAVLSSKQNWGNSDFDSSVLLNLKSTTQGFMLPSMTIAQRTSIASPIAGLQIHTEDGTDSIPYYNHSVNGWIPTGRYALNGTTINGGSAPTVNQIFTSAQIDGRLSYAPLGWTYSGGKSTVYPVKYSGTGGGGYANERVNLGTGTYRFNEIRQKIAYMYNTISGQQAIRMISVGNYKSTLHPCGTSAGTDYGGTAIGSDENAFAKFVDESTVGKVSRGFVVNDTYAVGSSAIAQMGMEETAVLQADSTTRGFLPPRMTGAQVEAISTPAEGLMVYATSAGAGDVTGKGWWGYDGTNWVQLG